MRGTELRDELAKRLGTPDLPDGVWQVLDEEGLLGHATATDELEDVERDARRLLRVFQAGVEYERERPSPQGREQANPGSKVIPIELREPEAERGRALGEFLASLGDEDSARSARDAKPIAAEVSWHWGGRRPPLWRITLAVLPWVNAKEVERTYRLIQRQVIGKDNRPLSARSVGVFRFVEDVRGSTGDSLSWRRILALYNEMYPKGHRLHFKDADPRNFQRTYERAYAEIVGCGFNYRLRRRELTPDEKQEAKEALAKAEEIKALDMTRRVRQPAT